MLRQLSRVLRACLALTVLGAGLILGTPGTAAAADDSSTPANYTFAAVPTVDDRGTESLDDDVTTFTYTLIAAPDTTGGQGISHALFATFCVTPIGFTAEQFEAKDGSTDDVGLKYESIKIGDSFAFDFAGNYLADSDGASIIIKQGDDSRTVDVAGPACPARQDPSPCEDDEVRNAAGACEVPCEDDEVRNAAGECEVPCEDDEVRNAAGECDTPIIPVINVPVVSPDTCPDGSLMTDVDCTKVLPDTATPAIPATPAVPAEPVLSVLPDAGTPAVVPVAAPAPAVADTAVLGAQVQRAPLARTGSSSVGLAAFGALLLALGTSSTLLGRRTART